MSAMLRRLIEEHGQQEDPKSKLIVELATDLQTAEHQSHDRVAMMCATIEDMIRFHIKTDRYAMFFAFLILAGLGVVVFW